jgi:hypothetical protein
MSDQWYYSENGQQRGPVAREALEQICTGGHVRPGDMVWTAGMATWQPAGQVSGLFGSGSAPPPHPGNASGASLGYATPGNYGAPPSIGQDAGMRWLLPVGRSPWAIVAGYFGLFAVLFIPAPLALIFGLIAFGDIRRHPERHGMGRAVFGIVMGLIFSVFLVLFLIARLH